LEVEYQVFVNGKPVLGNSALNALGIAISETVTVTSGSALNGRGDGVWCPNGANCSTAGSMNPSGEFWDILAGGPSTANQTFSFNGQALAVTNFTGSPTVLNNTYNSPGQSISVGGGSLIGNSKTRHCGANNGDPER
jgi:type IV secretory pathway TrbL component